MDTIFSHQSLSPQENDIIIIDGIKSKFIGDVQQLQASQFLHPSASMLYCSMIKHIHKYSNCNIYLGKSNELLVISNLATKDIKGRAVSYSFYCKKADDYFQIISVLDKYCDIAGVALSEIDRQSIKEVFFLKKNRFYIYGGLALILLAIGKLIF